jgi:hypothetical protein
MNRSILSVASLVLFAAVAACSGKDTSNTGATVSSIAVTPDPCGVGKTDSMQMTAVAKFSDNSTEDITSVSDVTWTTSSTAVATVDDKGNLTGVSGGAITVTASFQGKSGSAGCVVGP